MDKNTYFFVYFQTFFSDFRHENTEKGMKRRKKVENNRKKVFQPALICTQHPKAGQNTQHCCIRNGPFLKVHNKKSFYPLLK